jgi:outer membrane translocation and assembly module TamA|tara:strand:- start:335 stop:943 length:609 start_codon:yes stop_codon:yes gene_type:complete
MAFDPITGMIVGQALSSIMGGYAKAEEYARQDMAFQQQEFQRKLEVDNQNFVINQRNTNRLINNRRLAKSAAQQLAAQQQDIQDSYDANSRALAQQMASADATLKAGLGARNINPASGSGAALLRMAQQTARQSHRNLTRQTNIARRNAKVQYQNIINKRDLTTESNVYFMKGVSPAGDGGSAITAGWLGAAGSVAGGFLGG